MFLTTKSVSVNQKPLNSCGEYNSFEGKQVIFSYSEYALKNVNDNWSNDKI